MDSMNAPLLKDGMNDDMNAAGAAGGRGGGMAVDMNAPMDADLDADQYAEADEGEIAPPAYGGMIGDVAPSAPPEGSLVFTEAQPGDFKEYSLNEEEARNSMVGYADEQCCWGTGAAKKMEIKEVQTSTKYLYVLDTFTEQRTTSWEKVPFYRHNQVDVDCEENGPPPDIWSIIVNPQAHFVQSSTCLPIPHTDSVGDCSRCRGRGCVRCTHCHGRGRERCHHCNGTGRIEVHNSAKAGGGGAHHGGHHGGGKKTHKDCHHCHGRGKKRCHQCRGDGRVDCHICEGQGVLKWFQQLTVTWRVHKTDNVIYRGGEGGKDNGLPDHMIAGASSDQVLSVQGQRVAPLGMGLDAGLQDASRNAINAHAGAWPLEVILQQRQYVGIVPVFDVRCNSKGGDRFWVYGLDKRVYAPSYPQTCCWLCSIM